MPLRFPLIACLLALSLPPASPLMAQTAILDYKFEEVRQIQGHTDEITSIAFSPNVKLVAAATSRGTIRVWELKSGRQVSVHTQAGNVQSIVFAEDSQSVYFGGPGVVLARWNPFNGDVDKLVPHQGALNGVSFVSFAPKANLALTGPGWVENPATKELVPVTIWDLETGQAVKEWKLRAEKVTHVSLTPDGQKILVTASNYSNTKNPVSFHAKAWNLKSDRDVFQFATEQRTGIIQATLSQDARFAYAVGSKTAETRVWDMKSGKMIHEHEFYYRNGGIAALAAYPIPHLVATIRKFGLKTNLSLLDLSKGRELAVLPQGDFAFEEVVAFSPDGRFVATATKDHTLRLFRVEPARPGVEPLPVQPGAVPEVVSKGLPNRSTVFEPSESFVIPSRADTFAVSPDGKLIATGHHDGTVLLWNAETGKKLRKIAEHERMVARVVFTPDGNEVISSGSALLLSDLARKKKPRVLLEWRKGLHADHLAFTKDGKSVVVGGYIGDVVFIEIDSGKVTRKLRVGYPLAMALSPDDKTLIAAWRGKVRLFDVESGREKDSLLHPGTVDAFLFIGKGDQIISASDDGKIRFWKTSTLEEIREFDVGVSSFVGPALARDKLLAASRVHSIRVWDIASGRQIALLGDDRSKRPMELAFTNDGKSLFAVFHDQTIQRWDVSK